MLLLPGIVLGAAVVCAASLLVAAVKLLLGTGIQVDKSLRGYCGVIRRGVDAYQGGAAVPERVPEPRAQPQPSAPNPNPNPNPQPEPSTRTLGPRPQPPPPAPLSLPTEPAQVPQGVPVPQGVSMERERIPVQVPLGTGAPHSAPTPHTSRRRVRARPTRLSAAPAHQAGQPVHTSQCAAPCLG